MDRSIRLGLLGFAVALSLVAAALECNQPSTTAVVADAALPFPSIVLQPSVTSRTVPGGTVWQVRACVTQGEAGASTWTCMDTAADAGTPVQGLTLSFATTTTGVTFSPPTNITDAYGIASSEVVVPFGTVVAVTVSGGGGVGTTYLPTADAGPFSAEVILLPVGSPVATGTLTPTGELYTFTVAATVPPDAGTGAGPVEGISVSFATTTTGVSFSPAAVTTNSSGQASSSVVIPYGTQIEAVASGGGAIGAPMPQAAPAVTLAPGALHPTGTFLPTGEVCTLSVQATVDGGGTSGVQKVAGLLVGFATTTSGVTFSPASVPTDSDGGAVSNVIVPYGTQVQTIVSGGGSVVPTAPPAGGDAPTVTLTPMSFAATGTVLPTGEVYQLAIKASAAYPGSKPCHPCKEGAALEGLSVTFATTTTGVTFSPASVMTDADGLASSNVIVPYGTQVQAVVSGGGAVNTKQLTARIVILAPQTPIAAMQPFVPTGEIFTLMVDVSVADAGALEGLNVTFATTTSGVLFSPATVPTNDAGAATSNVIIPYGTQVQAVVSGGGDVVATTTMSAPAVTLDAGLNLPNSTASCTTGPCAVQATASVGGTPLAGLPISFAFTSFLNDAGAPLGSSPIAGPASTILTGADGGAQYSFTIPAGVGGFTAIVSGGGAAASSPYGLVP